MLGLNSEAIGSRDMDLETLEEVGNWGFLGENC
jgi:hypothetical protein